MELARILNRLWGLRRWAVVVVPVAVLAALFSAYRVHLGVPPTIEKKGFEQGAAQIQMLVDAPQSPIMDVTGNVAPLSLRALIFARLMRSGPVLDEISRATGIPPNAIAFQALAGNLSRISGTNKPVGPRANQLLDDPKRYIILANAELVGQNPLPVVTVYTQGPTPDAAVDLAEGAVTGFASFVRKTENRDAVPSRNRASIRPLGRAVGGLINPGVNPSVMLLVFAAVFLVGCGAVLAVSNVVEGIRRQRLEEAALGERPAPAMVPRTAQVEPAPRLGSTPVIAAEPAGSSYESPRYGYQSPPRSHEGTRLPNVSAGRQYASPPQRQAPGYGIPPARAAYPSERASARANGGSERVGEGNGVVKGGAASRAWRAVLRRL